MTFEEWGQYLKSKTADEMETLITLKDALAPSTNESWVCNDGPRVKKSVRKALWSICSALQYRNVAWVADGDLPLVTGVSLRRSYDVLRQCSGYISVGTKSGGVGPYAHVVDSGVRIAINPALGYRWYAPEDAGMRDLKFRFWYEIKCSQKKWFDMVLERSYGDSMIFEERQQ